MGFRTVDVSPPTLSQAVPTKPLTNTPTSKNTVCKAFAVTRSMTTDTSLLRIPSEATITLIQVFVPVASNAGTTATINVGLNLGGTITTGFFVTGQSVLATGSFSPSSANLFNLQPTPNSVVGSIEAGSITAFNQDIEITAKYAETGTASTLGGPFYVLVTYAR